MERFDSRTGLKTRESLSPDKQLAMLICYVVWYAVRRYTRTHARTHARTGIHRPIKVSVVDCVGFQRLPTLLLSVRHISSLKIYVRKIHMQYLCQTVIAVSAICNRSDCDAGNSETATSISWMLCEDHMYWPDLVCCK